MFTYLPFCLNLFFICYRYREKEKDSNGNKTPELHKHYQQINSHHRNFEEILERDHGLPTSAPNADILKTHSNPVYPNPNRHHNHERHHGGSGSSVGGGAGSPVIPAGNGPTPAPGAPGGSKYNYHVVAFFIKITSVPVYLLISFH